MKGRGLFGLLVLAVGVLLVIWVYNAFVAKPGESIATLGQKKAAMIAMAVGAGLLAAKAASITAMMASMVG